jgi:curved DNA-binding protein CbpA
MQRASDRTADEEPVPRLAPGWEAKGSRLSPAEGFLLSRIDGATPWRTLRQIGGVAAEQADRCLERWVAEGLVVVEARAPTRGRGGARAAAAGLDPSLDLPLEIQERVIAFEAKLSAPYHEVLGVPVDADERAIKRAYFQLCKVFHPDRYFRRNLGPFAARLDRIFKKLVLAYELLLDPATRAELERSLAAFPPEPEPAPAQAGPAGAPPRALDRRERLARLRKQFRIPKQVLAERRFKARQFHEAARVARHQKKWKDAASCVRLAIAFDPWTDAYKEDFAAIQAEVNQLRAAQLLEEASGALDSRSRSQALRLLEEAMIYRPSDAEVHLRAAEVACDLDDYERAHEYAERACELAPEEVRPLLVLARCLRGQGLRQKAAEAIERARKLDPQNPQVLDELRRFRQRPARASGGKR